MIIPISINPKVTINCFFPITINPNVISSFLKPITILPKIYPKDWTPFPKAFYPNITSSLFFETLFNNLRPIRFIYYQSVPICFINNIIFSSITFYNNLFLFLIICFNSNVFVFYSVTLIFNYSLWKNSGAYKSTR